MAKNEEPSRRLVALGVSVWLCVLVFVCLMLCVCLRHVLPVQVVSVLSTFMRECQECDNDNGEDIVRDGDTSPNERIPVHRPK